jgi:hypothetical protein
MPYCSGGAILIALLLFVAWFLPPGRPPAGAGGWLHQRRSGTTGRYRISREQDLNAFNSNICQWLAGYGYIPQANTEVATALGATNWNAAGILFSRYYNADNHIHMFVPAYDDPLHNFQAVYFELVLVGEERDVRRRMAEFDATREAFARQFPSNWESDH